MEFTKWRQSISDILSVTENNLAQDDFPRRQSRQAPGLTSREVYPSSKQAMVIPTGYGGRQNVTEKTENEVYVDTSLAYRIDSITLQVSTLQKDFDYYKATMGEREADLETKSMTIHDKMDHLKKQWNAAETRLNAKLETVEEAVIQTNSDLLTRVPGVNRTQHNVPEEEYVLKSEHDRVCMKLKLLEDHIYRVETSSRQIETNIRTLVQDEIENRISEIRNDAVSAGRKAAGNEIKCKFDFIRNELDDQISTVTTKSRNEIARSLTEFKASQAVALDTSMEHANTTASSLRATLESIVLWKDVAATRLTDLENDKTSLASRTRTEMLQIVEDNQQQTERALTSYDDRLKRQFETLALHSTAQDRLDSTMARLKLDQQTVGNKMQQLESRNEKSLAVLMETVRSCSAEQASTTEALQKEFQKSASEIRKDLENQVARSVEKSLPMHLVDQDALSKAVGNLSATIGTVEDALSTRINGVSSQQKTQHNDVVSMFQTKLSQMQQNISQQAPPPSPGSPVRRVATDLDALRVMVESIEKNKPPPSASSPIRKVTSELAVLKEKMESLERPPVSPKKKISKPPPAPVLSEGEGWSSGYETGGDSTHTANLQELGKLISHARDELASSTRVALDSAATESLISKFAMVSSACHLPTNLDIHSPSAHTPSVTTAASTEPTEESGESVGSSTPSSISEDGLMRDWPYEGEGDSVNT